jgi:hypothetical protein
MLDVQRITAVGVFLQVGQHRRIDQVTIDRVRVTRRVP